jgi:REP element-mobilizing transposase RayT
MTAPRQVLEGTTYLVTRRASERRLFLRPSKQTNAIVGFLLSALAERYGILLHAVCVMSNHLHFVLTDPHARLPEFLRDLDALVARAMNRLLRRSDAFFERDSYSAIPLETPTDILDKMVYVLANPIAAGLVRHGSEWPGLWFAPTLIGGEGVAFDRPKEFFREKGPLPAKARLRLHPPPSFENEPGLVAELLRRLARAEDEATARLGAAGRSFLGVARVLAQKWYARPRTDEPHGTLNPRVACKDKWKRIEALLRLAEFRSAYGDALAAWKAGVRDVTFPSGTWLMRVQHGVCCAVSH